MEFFPALIFSLPFVGFVALVAKAVMAPAIDDTAGRAKVAAPKAPVLSTRRAPTPARVVGTPANDDVVVLHRRLRNMLLGDDESVARLVAYEMSRDPSCTKVAAYERVIESIQRDNVRFD